MKQHPQSILLAAICLGLTACASHRPAIQPFPIKAPAPAPVAIGKVSTVNTNAGFALIQTTAMPEIGTMLQARSADGKQTASLRVSLLDKPPYVIADIMKGKPSVGEVVTK